MKSLIALVAFIAIACGGSDTAPDPNATVLGSYALTTYDGASLPTQGITSGSMALFSDHYEFAYSGAGAPNAYTERGTWRINGAALVLHSMTSVNGGTPPDWPGSVISGTLSMNAETNPNWTRLHPAMTFQK